MSTTLSLLRLARISNLPTVWSNVLAASVLAGGLGMSELVLVAIAMSALYTGGMFLNDAFDREVDARVRPERPLPSGEISPGAVWGIGGGLLACGVAGLAMFGLGAAAAGGALAAAILVYDAWHKGNPISPLIMGLCRALVYIGTVVAAGAALSAPIIGAALALLLYVAGLTLVAKGVAFRSLPTFWPAALLAAPIVLGLADGEITMASSLLAAVATGAIGWAVFRSKSGLASDRERAVGLLIASIALVDAVVASAHGNVMLALVCLAFFCLTLALQRVVPGT